MLHSYKLSRVKSDKITDTLELFKPNNPHTQVSPSVSIWMVFVTVFPIAHEVTDCEDGREWHCSNDQSSCYCAALIIR